MDKEPPKTAKKKHSVAPRKKTAAKKRVQKPQSGLAGLLSFFKDDAPPRSQRIDEKNAIHKHDSIARLVSRQTYVIIGLVFLVILLLPVLQPIYVYKGIQTDKKKRPFVALTMPNHTDRAIMSWAASSITEIMTFGFGDVRQKILSQKDRFTDEGWDSFVTAFDKQALIERFKMQQLVLTTAPVDMPIIVYKGPDEDYGYKWIVEMPVIMTYATSNNAKEQDRKIARLTIILVSPLQNKAGIGIQEWRII